jgi:hypothetical protein
MNKLLEAAAELCAFMTEREWKFCIIGGLAVQRWGEPRSTLDADFTLLTGWGDEERYVREILEHFESRIPGDFAFFIAQRIVLVRASNGIDIDIALGALPFEEIMIDRAVMVEFSPGLSMPCCSAEDLFIMKMFAGRTRDWLDAEGVAKRQLTMRTDYVLEYVREFSELKESPEMLERARQLLGGIT